MSQASVHGARPDVKNASELAAHGKETIAKGSKSFAIASMLFGRETQADVQMLYAWCRYCDDVIDGQDLGGDAPDAHLTPDEQARRLAALKRKTEMALNGEATGEAAFDGFALVAARHRMPHQYPMDLLDGFAMDVSDHAFETMDDTLRYCYGVAGCVGIMMAIVMGVSPQDERTLDRACDLGLAFQLTNICRDIIDDAKAGRVYLPAALLQRHGIDPSAQTVCDDANRDALAGVATVLLDEADRYYASASEGIRQLPPRAAAAIAAARNVYRDIGRLIRERKSHAWDERAYTSKPRKIWLATAGAVQGAPQPVLLRNKPSAPRASLWTRPQRSAATA